MVERLLYRFRVQVDVTNGELSGLLDVLHSLLNIGGRVAAHRFVDIRLRTFENMTSLIFLGLSNQIILALGFFLDEVD